MMTRRAWIGGALAAASCGRRKGTGYPGFAIVASEAEHSLTAVSLLQFRVTRQLGLEAAPSQVTAIPGQPMLLCLLPSRGTLVAVDSEGVAVRHKVRVGDESLSIRIDPDGKRVWVLNKSPNTLVAVDLGTFKTSARVRLPGPAGSMDFHDGRGAVTLPGSGDIAVIEHERIVRTIATGIAPEMISFRQDGGVALAGDPEGRMLAAVDPAAGRLVVKLPLPVKPRRYCYNFDGGQLFITGEGMDAVTIVSPYQTEVNQTILAGHAPAGMAVTRTASPAYLFVTNSASGDVTVIDIDTQRVLARIPVGQEPQDILITPDNQYALVLNRKSGDMAVIRVAALESANHRNKTAGLFTMIPIATRPVSVAVSGA